MVSKMTNNILFDENGMLIVSDSVKKKLKQNEIKKEEQKQFLEDYCVRNL